MLKILATAFIMALTTCYPVHANMETFAGAKTNDIWKDGEILASGTTDSELLAVIKHKKKIYHCRSKMLGPIVAPTCELYMD